MPIGIFAGARGAFRWRPRSSTENLRAAACRSRVMIFADRRDRARSCWSATARWSRSATPPLSGSAPTRSVFWRRTASAKALIALPVALAVAALFAFLTGLVCLRTKGVYFIMITLAFGQMAFFTATSLAPYGGRRRPDRSRARKHARGLPLLAKNERALLLRRASVALLGAYLLCRALVGSRFGRVLRGAREKSRPHRERWVSTSTASSYAPM